MLRTGGIAVFAAALAAPALAQTPAPPLTTAPLNGAAYVMIAHSDPDHMDDATTEMGEAPTGPGTALDATRPPSRFPTVIETGYEELPEH